LGRGGRSSGRPRTDDPSHGVAINRRDTRAFVAINRNAK
jgi:hypothetical protein